MRLTLRKAAWACALALGGGSALLTPSAGAGDFGYGGGPWPGRARWVFGRNLVRGPDARFSCVVWQGIYPPPPPTWGPPPSCSPAWVGGEYYEYQEFQPVGYGGTWVVAPVIGSPAPASPFAEPQGFVGYPSPQTAVGSQQAAGLVDQSPAIVPPTKGYPSDQALVAPQSPPVPQAESAYAPQPESPYATPPVPSP